VVFRPKMLPSVRHEINNVLAALMAEAQLLQMEELTPEQMNGADRIVSHSRRLRDLLRVVQPAEPDPHTD
jgi:nitrogen-specific signal transduction histidine kinase